MGSDDTEVCGFMDAKLAGHRAKKRSLGAPWKVWRRHWCSVRKLGPGLGLEVLLDHGVGGGPSPCSSASLGHHHQHQQQQLPDKDSRIRIPADAIVCRTESRTKQFAFGIFPPRQRKPLLYLAAGSEGDSQRWMAAIRQLLRPRRHRLVDGAAGVHSVSMVDNAHSRSAGLTGLYGDLVASRSGVFVKDVHSGEIVETLEWDEMDGFHLATFGRPDDVKRICVVHTTRQFRGGVGELHFFCQDAPRLLQDLVTRGRGPRSRRAGGGPTQRPLSLSEGDLRLAAAQQDPCGPVGPGSQALRHRIAANIVSAGLGLLLSSKAGSEAKLANEIVDGALEKMSSRASGAHIRRAVDNVYQPEPALASHVTSSLEELEEPASRRVSSISVSSGIYEEIQDDLVPATRRRLPSNLYENPDSLILNSSMSFQPPPLPPRQRHAPASVRVESASDEGFDSEGGTTRSATPNTISDATPTPEDKMSESSCVLVDTSEYVPMSPRPKDIALLELQKQTQQENMYMVMR